MPGAHNVLNATAAIAAGIGLEIPVEIIRTALENFRGVDRRFQLKGKAGGVTVIDDYGHHPNRNQSHPGRSEAVRLPQDSRSLPTAPLHPHTGVDGKFATAFQDADTLRILDIYAASEKPIEGISAEILATRIQEASGQRVRYGPSFAEVAESVSSEAEDGDMILTLGAGNVSQLGPMIVEKLQSRQPVGPSG